MSVTSKSLPPMFTLHTNAFHWYFVSIPNLLPKGNKATKKTRVNIRKLKSEEKKKNIKERG